MPCGIPRPYQGGRDFRTGASHFFGHLYVRFNTEVGIWKSFLQKNFRHLHVRFNTVIVKALRKNVNLFFRVYWNYTTIRVGCQELFVYGGQLGRSAMLNQNQNQNQRYEAPMGFTGYECLNEVSENNSVIHGR
ncbi:MAG: hypothetical protein OXU36_21735 [Candidatus Poribacteria bacterium]|nr:hypothetical protein [Candidatus Poribacteria bacterium]